MTVDYAAMVLAVARAAGCTCDPEVTADSQPAPGVVRHVRVAHDDWCALLVRLERRN